MAGNRVSVMLPYLPVDEGTPFSGCGWSIHDCIARSRTVSGRRVTHSCQWPIAFRFR